VNPAPTLTLTNGVKMPRLGLGTWPMDDAEATMAQAVRLAEDIGDGLQRAFCQAWPSKWNVSSPYPLWRYSSARLTASLNATSIENTSAAWHSESRK